MKFLITNFKIIISLAIPTGWVKAQIIAVDEAGKKTDKVLQIDDDETDAGDSSSDDDFKISKKRKRSDSSDNQKRKKKRTQ